MMNGYETQSMTESPSGSGLQMQTQPHQQTQSFQQPQMLQQAEQMIRQAQYQQAQEHLTRMGVSNVSQQLNKAEQMLHDVMQDLRHTQIQLQTQMDAQMRQIASSMQKIEQTIGQFKTVEQTVLNRPPSAPFQA